jgi:hypothetical protein
MEATVFMATQKMPRNSAYSHCRLLTVDSQYRSNTPGRGFAAPQDA